MENNAHYFEIVLGRAARRPLLHARSATRLTPPEVEYIVSDCGAKVLIASLAKRELARGARASAARSCAARFMVGRRGRRASTSWDEAVARAARRRRIADEMRGRDHALLVGHHRTAEGREAPAARATRSGRPTGARDAASKVLYGVDADTIYLSPAPLYHAAPLRFTMTVHAPRRRRGRDGALRPRARARADRAHRVTHSQWVPTMFVRMLKLPGGGARAATTSRACGSRSTPPRPAPCPVKEQMIEWWGPIIYEYYAGTEGNGFCAIDSKEWLAHKGSVGPRRLTRSVHILDDDGSELPPGEAGHDLLRERREVRVPQRPARRRPSAQEPAGLDHARRHRHTSTRTATSTSPTARPT